MRASVRLVVLGFLLGLFTVDPAAAHGGKYKGPPDVVPPSIGNPAGDRGGPPGSPSGPVTRGSGTPRTEAPGVRAPVRPGAGRLAAGPITGRGRSRPGESLEKWQIWWSLNRERFLNRKARIRGDLPRSGSPGFFLGHGSQARRVVSSTGPTATRLREQVLPALQGVLRRETSPDILDSTLLAIGRIGNDPDLLEAILPFLSSPVQSVREAAVMAMGILGGSDAIPVLSHLLLDDIEGRRRTASPSGVPTRTRAFAAVALGLLSGDEARREIAPILRRSYEKACRESFLDIPITTVLAMGLLQSPELTPDLQAILDTAPHPYVRAYAANSLGWIGARESREKLTRLLDPKNPEASVHVRRSCAVSLGLLATPEDAASIRALESWAGSGREPITRNFAAMALARIGGEESKTFLLRSLVKGRQRTFRPWGALALGVWSFRAGQPEPAAAKAIRTRLHQESDPQVRGAYCVALGLLQDRESSRDLLDLVRRESDPELRGYAALALGMLNATEARDALVEILHENAREEKLLRQAATGLALMGGKDVTGILVDALRKARTTFTQGSVALALGLIGDEAAVQPLLDLLQDESGLDRSRAFAAVALGMICDKDDYPWTDRITSNLNYRMQVESVRELFDIL